MSNKVVLFYPPYAGKPLGPPLSLLSLASPLIEDGFQVSIVDGSVETDFKRIVAQEIKNAVCLGISLLTGQMIRSAVDVARLFRQLRPELPIIFGGWHPSLLPAQTLDADFIDVVVRAQGERTIVEIARLLSEGKPLDNVRGISLKLADGVHHNPERPVENVNDLPTPAFDLGNLDAYEKITGVRKLPYASSVGCPYACNYCTDQVFYKRRFNAYSASRVVQEVTELVSRYHLSEVAFLDSNFPVNIKRAVEIARGFLESKIRFRWTFQASTDLLCRMSDDDVDRKSTRLN